MRHNKLALYVHLVWTTWDRVPVIAPEIERALYRCIESELIQLDCKILAIGGIEDHIHVFIEMPSTAQISEIAKQIKGVSSHFVNEILQPGWGFKWQASYSAFTVSRWDVAKIKGYIARQKEHHANGTVKSQLEIIGVGKYLRDASE